MCCISSLSTRFPWSWVPGLSTHFSHFLSFSDGTEDKEVEPKDDTEGNAFDLFSFGLIYTLRGKASEPDSDDIHMEIYSHICFVMQKCNEMQKIWNIQ